jgi:hypothetical protein
VNISKFKNMKVEPQEKVLRLLAHHFFLVEKLFQFKPEAHESVPPIRRYDVIVDEL